MATLPDDTLRKVLKVFQGVGISTNILKDSSTDSTDRDSVATRSGHQQAADCCQRARTADIAADYRGNQGPR